MKRRGSFARLDDTVLGAPGTRRGWFSDLFLGLHPWLVPVYGIAVIVGLILLVTAAARGSGQLAVTGTVWMLGGLLYLWVSHGQPHKPPRG